MHRMLLVSGVVAVMIVTGAMMALTLSPAASSVHLKGGKNAEPSFTDNGLSLSADGEISGLGNGDVLIEIEAEADVTSTCTNRGGNAAPGQNPAPITVIGSVSILDEEKKNGNTPFSVTTIPPDPEIPGAPDCPNPNWTESIDDLAFTSATISVHQGGSLVLTVDCSFDPPTSDGAVSKQDVSCTQT